MLIRPHTLRIPCRRCNRTGNNIRKYSLQPPNSRIPFQPDSSPKSDIPATWPSKPSPRDEPPPQSATLLDLLPFYTTKVPGSKSKHISSFLPTTEPQFYPQPQKFILAARSFNRSKPTNLPDPATEEESLHIHVSNSKKDMSIVITNERGEQVISLLMERQMLTLAGGVGEMTTTEEGVRKFVEKYPFVLDQAKVELVLKGFGPGRLSGLTTILGPLGYELMNKLSKSTKAR